MNADIGPYVINVYINNCMLSCSDITHSHTRLSDTAALLGAPYISSRRTRSWLVLTQKPHG